MAIENETLLKYVHQYRAEHTKVSTRVTHYLGIPMIVASLPLIPTIPPLGVSMFVGGWALQFLGHRFEGNKPSFYSDPLYLAIGPLWVAIELVEAVTGRTLVPEAGETSHPSEVLANGAGTHVSTAA